MLIFNARVYFFSFSYLHQKAILYVLNLKIAIPMHYICSCTWKNDYGIGKTTFSYTHNESITYSLHYVVLNYLIFPYWYILKLNCKVVLRSWFIFVYVLSLCINLIYVQIQDKWNIYIHWRVAGVSKDGQIRHFFHRPSKAYTTGTRKRRKVHTDEEGSETRWHKTGKTRPVFVGGAVKGFKKILVLYTNYGRQKKPEKTNWVMHQYHLGSNEEEKDGELVVSKVFYQTQPRQCGTSIIKQDLYDEERLTNQGVVDDDNIVPRSATLMEYYNNTSFINYEHVGGRNNRETSPQLIPNLVMQGDSSSFIRLAMDATKARLNTK